jgi:ammonium transporter, Amt family
MDDVPIAMLLGSIALLARVGLAWYATGLSRSKNAAGAVLRNVLDFCVAALAFWAIGAAVCFGDRHLIVGADAKWTANHFFHLVLVLFASAVPIGSAGERSKLLPLGVLSFLVAGVVVPLSMHWAWHGWLHHRDFIDAAGAAAIHLAAGMSALAVALVLGPRSGKYNRDGSSNMIPGHSLPLASVGVLMLLVAWLPYVIGASAANAHLTGRTPANVLLAGAAAGLAALVSSVVRYGKGDVVLVYSGLLGGLVAITGAANVLPTYGAVAVGAIAGLIVPYVMVHIDLRFKVDDPSGAVAIHGVGGLIGALVPGIYGIRQLGVQALGALAIALLALLAVAGLLVVLKKTVGIRSKEADEFDGLDLAEHDLNAYPDFQQTTIKSYHLREA